MRAFLLENTLKQLYLSLVLPYMDYCCVVWSEYARSLSARLERLIAELCNEADLS